ncbi:hypothetical protein B0H19DRAFT_1272065 [Mycena capillaripes]|nr:hypothetical protein B0H19DRAFT_1272065 [Mycena capillaripes]
MSTTSTTRVSAADGLRVQLHRDDPQAGDRLIPLLRKVGIVFYVYSPIAGGLLFKTSSYSILGFSRCSEQLREGGGVVSQGTTLVGGRRPKTPGAAGRGWPTAGLPFIQHRCEIRRRCHLRRQQPLPDRRDPRLAQAWVDKHRGTLMPEGASCATNMWQIQPTKDSSMGINGRNQSSELQLFEND